MLKRLALVVAALAAVCVAPAYADGSDENPWADSSTAGANNGEATGNFTHKTDAVQPYIHEEKGRLVQGQYRQAQKSTKDTLMQGFGRQTSMGGPLIFAGRNTFIAPQNLALQTEHHSLWGGKLQPAHLDSLVTHNATPFQTFGDEGTDGPPPLSSFNTIESSVQATTGHPSDAPPAW
jgi:hypothetical protein